MVQHLSRSEFVQFVVCTGFLMMNAGYTNGAGMVGLAATLSHMTGVTTRIGTSVALGNYLQLTVDIATVCSFTAGCFISAMILGPNGKYNLGWRYSIGFLIEGTCLLIVSLQLPFTQPAYLAKSFVAFSMGIQNGMTSVWSGGLGRSTHLTGFLADTAIITGFWFVAQTKSDFWKLQFMIPLYFSFMFGAFLGGEGFIHLGKKVFVAPAIISYTIAIILAVRDYQSRKQNLISTQQAQNRTEIANIASQESTEAAAVITSLATAAIATTITDTTSSLNPSTPQGDGSQQNDFLSNDFT